MSAWNFPEREPPNSEAGSLRGEQTVHLAAGDGGVGEAGEGA